MKTPCSIIILALMAIMGCRSAEIAYTPAMESDAMPVSGRQGWQIGQIISYGNFTTDKVRRGWTKGFDLPFYLRFQGAKEKISFTQFGPDNLEAEVACISKFKSLELPLIKDYFSVPLVHKNFFAGSITLENGAVNWDFILYNPNGDFLRDKPTTGYLKSRTDVISIQPVRGLDGQPRWIKGAYVYGHEFWMDGKVVAAVSMVNKGTVWMDQRLDAQMKTVIAAVATGLLLRTDVEENTTASGDAYAGQDFPYHR